VAVILLLIGFAIIPSGCEHFVNGIEWFGHRLNLGEGAVGGVLAAVGTALPETIIPIIAIVFTGGAAGVEVGTGAILEMSRAWLRPAGSTTLAVVARVLVSLSRPSGEVQERVLQRSPVLWWECEARLRVARDR
jgi:hypothetical protein